MTRNSPGVHHQQNRWMYYCTGGHGNPLQFSCLENPMDRGAWQGTAQRVPKSHTWLKRLSSHTHAGAEALHRNKMIYSKLNSMNESHRCDDEWRKANTKECITQIHMKFKNIQNYATEMEDIKVVVSWCESWCQLCWSWQSVQGGRSCYQFLSWYWWLMLSCFSRVQLFATLWTVARQAPLSTGFSRQEWCSGLTFPSPGDLPNSGIKPTSLMSPALAGGFFTTSTTWEVDIDYASTDQLRSINL